MESNLLNDGQSRLWFLLLIVRHWLIWRQKLSPIVRGKCRGRQRADRGHMGQQMGKIRIKPNDAESSDFDTE